MYRVAVLVTGSPRFVEQGAAWWNAHLPENIEFDLYGHCWSEHDHIGSVRYYDADFDIDENLFSGWNFKDFKIVSYCEGDRTVTNCDKKEEFIKELKRTVDFYKFNQETFKGIDLMCNENIINDFNNLKLDKKYYLHHCDIKEN